MTELLSDENTVALLVAVFGILSKLLEHWLKKRADGKIDKTAERLDRIELLLKIRMQEEEIARLESHIAKEAESSHDRS